MHSSSVCMLIWSSKGKQKEIRRVPFIRFSRGRRFGSMFESFFWFFCCFCRMGLRDKQEREIVHVLMDCCLQEKTFNAYYAVLGEKFCSHDRRFQVKHAENLHQSNFIHRYSELKPGLMASFHSDAHI